MDGVLADAADVRYRARAGMAHVRLSLYDPVAMGSDLQQIIDRIAERKAALDALRPLHPGLLRSLRKFHDIELTYTSNAIEGNTLTLRETSEVIEHGITVGGKALRDHLEALDHYDAVQFVREVADRNTMLGETTVTELHRRIVLRSHSEIAGVYRIYPRRIAGSQAILPNPRKLPQLMADFGASLGMIGATPDTAFAAHFRLTAIHPFGDGNGRTARLLMNLILLRQGYPPIAVRPEDRAAYLDALETASVRDDLGPFQLLMHRRLNETLDDYLAAFREVAPDA
jgi:Fic family protein